jgi:hypothetical protein
MFKPAICAIGLLAAAVPPFATAYGANPVVCSGAPVKCTEIPAADHAENYRGQGEHKAAQGQSINEWCRAHNPNPAAVARCVHAELGRLGPSAPPTAPVQQPAQQTPADPYADVVNKGLRERYLRVKSETLDEIRFVGYARACGALMDVAASVLWSNRVHARIYDDPEMSNLDFLAGPNKLGHADVNRAMRDGGARAQSQGCDFFKEHPEVVLELRRQAQ